MIEGVSGVTAIDVKVEFPKKLQPQKKKVGAKLRNIRVFLNLITVVLPEFSALDESASAFSCLCVLSPSTKCS